MHGVVFGIGPYRPMRYRKPAQFGASENETKSSFSFILRPRGRHGRTVATGLFSTNMNGCPLRQLYVCPVRVDVHNGFSVGRLHGYRIGTGVPHRLSQQMCGIGYVSFPVSPLGFGHRPTWVVLRSCMGFPEETGRHGVVAPRTAWGFLRTASLTAPSADLPPASMRVVFCSRFPAQRARCDNSRQLPTRQRQRARQFRRRLPARSRLKP